MFLSTSQFSIFYYRCVYPLDTNHAHRYLNSRAFLVAQMVKNLPAMRGPGFNPWVRKIPGEGNGYPLQYSYLETSMD